MAMNVKLRVCTWNVGNAAPPDDLKSWLGTGSNEFDIIAIGAQEAAYGVEKATSNLLALSPRVSISRDFGSRIPTDEKGASSAQTSGFKQLRALSRVFRGAKETVRDGTARKLRSKPSTSDDFCEDDYQIPSKKGNSSSTRPKNPASTRSTLRRRDTSLFLAFNTPTEKRNNGFHEEKNMQSLGSFGTTRSRTTPTSSTIPTNNDKSFAEERFRRGYSTEISTPSKTVSDGELDPRGDIESVDPIVDQFVRKNAESKHSSVPDSEHPFSLFEEPLRLLRRQSTETSICGSIDDDSLGFNYPLEDEQSDVDIREEDNSNDHSKVDEDVKHAPNITKYETKSNPKKEEELQQSYGLEDKLKYQREQQEDQKQEPSTEPERIDLRRIITPPTLTRTAARVSFNLSPVDIIPTSDFSTRDGSEFESESSVTASRKFSKIVQENMPKDYHLIAKHNLMEIRLLIYVHSRFRRHVKKIDCVSEATGIGKVVGNKGGVAVKLLLNDTSICFVCCHLAAHEGAKYLQQRHEDIAEIMRNIERHKTLGLPVIHQFDHIFWLGDLNYRLDIKQVIPGAIVWSHMDRFQYVTHLIEQGRCKDVYRLDELQAEMRKGSILAGFQEGPVLFPPTFKTGRGAGAGRYQSERVPSYCDRILWHSLPKHREHVTLMEYNSIPKVDTSDHKPVFASFKISIPKAATVIPIAVRMPAIRTTVDLLSLRVHGLYEKERGGVDEDFEYSILADGALEALPKVKRERTDVVATPPVIGHTRRVVTALFFGGGMLICERGHRTEIPIRDGRRVCLKSELPVLLLRPVRSIGDLMYKYIRVVFTRMGSRQGSSCIIPLGRLIEMRGMPVIRLELEVTKYGRKIADVTMELAFVLATDTWVDSENRVARIRRR